MLSSCVLHGRGVAGAHAPAGGVVGHDPAERAAARADVGEARQPVRDEAAVEPVREAPLAVEPHERGLRIDEPVDPPPVDLEVAGRPARRAPAGPAGARSAARDERLRSRKFSSSRRPCSVQIDSGWNWTPQCGRSRWERPITVPSAVHAERRTTAGTASTRSEW